MIGKSCRLPFGIHLYMVQVMTKSVSRSSQYGQIYEFSQVYMYLHSLYITYTYTFLYTWLVICRYFGVGHVHKSIRVHFFFA
jgi:hypothetical protein